MAKQTFDTNMVKWTKRGVALLTLVTVLGLAFAGITKTYSFAQKVEVYISLPNWLKRVENDVGVVKTDMTVVKDTQRQIIANQESQNERLAEIKRVLVGNPKR